MEVHQGPDSDEKGAGDSSSDDANEISLNITMLPTSNLLEVCDSFSEVVISSAWVENQKLKVNLCATEDSDAPLNIVVPKLLVPVVEQLRSEENIGLCQGPVPPKGIMNTIEAMLHRFLRICLDIVGGDTL